MTFILAHELRGRDITVNAVAPGSTATDMFLEGKDHELLTRLAERRPARAARHAGRHSPCRRLPRRPRRALGHGQTIRVNGGII
jgi:3-oxoacyl-[acyl-carrier protein] reductase